MVAARSAPKIFEGGSVPIGIPSLVPPPDAKPSFGWAPPSRLGGPKQADAAAPASRDDGKAAFLRAIHKAACAIFSTVLGPEANAAHRNHFHLDLARRKNSNVCE
jgi:hypothetical protein